MATAALWRRCREAEEEQRRLAYELRAQHEAFAAEREALLAKLRRAECTAAAAGVATASDVPRGNDEVSGVSDSNCPNHKCRTESAGRDGVRESIWLSIDDAKAVRSPTPSSSESLATTLTPSSAGWPSSPISSALQSPMHRSRSMTSFGVAGHGCSDAGDVNDSSSSCNNSRSANSCRRSHSASCSSSSSSMRSYAVGIDELGAVEALAELRAAARGLRCRRNEADLQRPPASSTPMTFVKSESSRRAVGVAARISAAAASTAAIVASPVANGGAPPSCWSVRAARTGFNLRACGRSAGCVLAEAREEKYHFASPPLWISSYHETVEPAWEAWARHEQCA